MGCSTNSPDINQVFVIEPLSITGGNPTLTACTTLFTNLVESCSGDTKIFMGTGVITFDGNLYTNNDLTATTINASTYFSGGTNLLDIIKLTSITGGTFNNSSDTLTLNKVDGSNINVTGFTDYYTTGTTLIGNTVYFDRNDALSAYTLDLASFSANTYVTGITFNNNQIIITRNDDVILGVYLNSFTGLTINGDFTVTGTTFLNTVIADTIGANSASFNDLNTNGFTADTINANNIYGNGSHLTGLPYVTGGTPNNALRFYVFTNSTGGTFTVPALTDISITGGTYSNGTTIFTNNTGGTFSINGYYTGATDVFVTGGTANNAAKTYVFTNNTGGTFSVAALIDLTITGGTYSNGSLTFINTTGGTFNVSGLYTGTTDLYVTGGTYNNTTGVATFKNNTGGTFSVNGFYTGSTDVFVTGTTFTPSSKNLRLTRNDNVNIDSTLPVRLFLNASVSTFGNVFTTIDTITGLTNNHNSFIISYITAYKDSTDYGFWKRTLAVNKVSGNISIIGENSDFDRISSGMTPNNVVYSANSGDVLIKISGETAKNYTWTSNWEIIS